VSRLAPILAVLLALAPELAHACAVCGAGVDDDQSRTAYLLTTLSLSVLPLALFGGFLLYLRAKHRIRSRDRAAREAVESQPGSIGGRDLRRAR
jgi:hypothetical protein